MSAIFQLHRASPKNAKHEGVPTGFGKKILETRGSYQGVTNQPPAWRCLAARTAAIWVAGALSKRTSVCAGALKVASNMARASSLFGKEANCSVTACGAST